MTDRPKSPMWPIAIVALVLGSVGAPIVYIAMGLVTPQGFHDLRGSSATTIAYYLGVAWMASATLTLVVGGATWKFLHGLAKDGFMSYLVIACVSALLVGMAANEGLLSPYIVALACINALLIRAVELVLLRKRAHRG